MSRETFLVFTKRPSGSKGVEGRGEYELVGESNGFRASDLLGRHFVICLQGRHYQTPVRLTAQGGKPRLRLDNPNDRKHQTHIAGLVASLLMLPSPCRSESRASHALPVLQDNAYLLDVSCRLLEASAEIAVVEPVLLTAHSGSLSTQSKKVVVEDRLAEIGELIQGIAFGNLPSEVAGALEAYDMSRKAAGRDYFYECRSAVDTIMEELRATDPSYLNGCDPLPFLCSELRLRVLTPEDVPNPELLPPVKDNEAAPAAIERRQRAEGWYRSRARRGYGARKFSRLVVSAYKGRCAICGEEMPAPYKGSSGIEAAHILPWAEYDLDVVQNGIALCRNHHWAFDNRVLSITCHRDNGGDYWIVPGANFAVFKQSLNRLPNFLVAEIGEAGGRKIDDALLPPDKSLRPSAEYLDRFNSLLLPVE